MGKTRKRRRVRIEDGRKPAASVKGQGRGAAGEAGAGLKIEGAKDVQCVESLAERTKRIAKKKY